MAAQFLIQIGQILGIGQLAGRLRALGRYLGGTRGRGIATLAGVERLERHREAGEPRVEIDAPRRERHFILRAVAAADG